MQGRTGHLTDLQATVLPDGHIIKANAHNANAKESFSSPLPSQQAKPLPRRNPSLSPQSTEILEDRCGPKNAEAIFSSQSCPALLF